MSHLTLEDVLSHKFLILCIAPVVIVYLVLMGANLVRERVLALRTFMVGADMLLGSVAALAVQIITGIYTMQLGDLERLQLRHVPYHLFGSVASLVAVLPLLILCLSLERRASEHRIERRGVALVSDMIAGALPLVGAGYIAAVRSM
ncbi:MAG TPA: hypothetical protein VNU97_02105 [Rhizomicrobium sp.]|nr:hypothetical protein [Rhizomicrobium sp.]